VAIIGCVLVLLGTSIAFVVFLTFPLPTSQAGPALPSFVRKVAAGTMAFFAVVAVLGLFTGIGVLRLKNWARISALVWSGITAVICGLSLVFVVFMPFPTPPNTATPANVATLIRAITGLFYGVPVVIAIWWLILFNRKAIAAQFLAPGSELDPSGFPGQPTSASRPPLPLPITVLAVFLLMSSVSLFLLFFVHLPVVLFAHSFRGPTGTAVWITTCLLSTVAGIGLLYRKAWSYRLTLALQLLWFLSGIVTLASPKYPDLMHEAISSMALSTATYPEYSIGQLRKFSYAGLAFPVLIAILLLYYRSRFFQASASGDFMPKAP
jgi:hypothetical protein